MGYRMANGRYARTADVDLGISGAKTATFQSTALEIGDQDTVRLNLAVTAASGTTPSMTVTIETSADGSTGWTSVGAFSAVTTTATARKVFGACDRFVRANCAISGTTPSFTFSLSGEAV